ncbi:uncharacterized protein LOC134269086, partial [Saccostrea cucullata]|uniref:uncharacterized protein LOC134269086 n=1 Tax=Saccostrea cuccullata TaxID=36930 RepID=UPI002ED0AB05
NTCNPLTPPGNGAISCAAWIFGQMCTMQCQEKFDIPYGIRTNDGSSNFNGQFVCSQSTGQYHPSNIVPNCSEIRQVSSSRLPGEFYYFAGDCNDPETLAQIKEKFINVMKQLEIGGWAGVCPNSTECNVNNTDVTCGPVSGKRKRSADETGYNWYNVPSGRYRRSTFKISVSFSVKTSWQNFISSVDTYNLMGMIQQSIFDIIKGLAVNGSFNVSGMDPDINSFSSGLSEPECPEGTAIKQSTMSCVPCSIGTYLDNSNPSQPTCRNCPKGSYKDSEDTATCTQCPHNTFTLDDGAESMSECLDKCDFGEFSTSGLMPCNICPRGTFSSIKMSKTCELCPHGKTSLSKSTAIDNCTDIDITFAKKGDAIFFDSNQFLESKSVALFAWIKNDNSSLVLLHGNSSSFYMTIKYGKTVLVDINGSKHSLNITGDMQDWHHVVLIISTETDTISVYINGVINAQTNLNSVGNVSVIRPDLSFAIFLTEDASSDISITGYQLTSNIPSDDEILLHSSACNYTRNDTLVTFSDVDWDTVDNSLIKTQSHCDIVNQCIPNPCNGHPCIDLVGNYRCSCNDSFTGETCEVPPDYCIIAPCQNGGVCQNGNNTYTCTCSGSYKGANCEIDVVNGGWSAWSDFSECSVTCNGGIKTRSRACNNPIPDPEGLDCNSSLSTESLLCNTKECPSCAELKLSFGNVVNCSNINGDTVCEVSCIVGYTFVPGNLPLKEYRCGQSTGYTWNGLTPACGKAKMPDRLSSTTEIEYNSSISCADSSTVLNTLQSNLESSLSCYNEGICELSTTINECEGKMETNSLQITLTATLPDEDLNLGHFYSTGNLSKALQSLVNIVVELENSTRKINESNDILTFDMGGVKYSPSIQQATGIVVCGLGQGSDGPICIDCPIGTYSTSGKCLLCPRGTYQSEIGGAECTNCPSGFTTKFEGSQNAANCSEVTNTTQDPLSKIPESNTAGVSEAVIIAVPVTIGVVFLIALSVFFWNYYLKIKNSKFDYSVLLCLDNRDTFVPAKA